MKAETQCIAVALELSEKGISDFYRTQEQRSNIVKPLHIDLIYRDNIPYYTILFRVLKIVNDIKQNQHGNS